MLDDRDIRQIEGCGITEDMIGRQLRNFREGFPFLDVEAAAAVGNGIKVVGEEEGVALQRIYDDYAAAHRIVKFVPASGAATRMFKELFEYVLTGQINSVAGDVLANMEKFAFYDLLQRYVGEGAVPERTIAAIISGSGLNYGIEPKALILFHKYGSKARTALEEHLSEGAQYAACGSGVYIHFTVSPEHRDGFEELLARVIPEYEERFGVKYEITLSEQSRSTDTIAVDRDGFPLRDAGGSLVLRPAGHGALIENLNGLDADLVFIKNIDNVTTDSRRGDTVRYKKIIAGLLVSLQRTAFGLINELRGDDPGDETLDRAHRFIEEELCVKFPKDLTGKAGDTGEGNRSAGRRRETYLAILDRPIRVCGMVRNDGEPGGGPVWALNADGTLSLQIAEPSQIAPRRMWTLSEGTHFNPVDIVCGVRDHRGVKFDLTQYVDRSAGLISEKSRDGVPIRVQELPGLWNGAMSRWNTVFVEVPVSTFTPVKIVTDLLRQEHQQ